MKKATVLLLVFLLILSFSACTASPQAQSKNVPMAPSAEYGTDGSDNSNEGSDGENGSENASNGSSEGTDSEDEAITEDLTSVIEAMESQLGDAPHDVIGLGIGYRKNSPITVPESAALQKLFREKTRIFAFYNMGCSPSLPVDDMDTYDPLAEDNTAAGYAKGNSYWAAKSGFTRYDSLGNLDAAVGKTSYDLVSIDKTVKKASTSEAQAVINSVGVYAYWIVSLPDENNLSGMVYNKGADDRQEPVKKGTLRFKRVGPGPSKVDVKVPVDKSGHYESEGELTAGHYEVSFDAKDGKGEKVLNDNWLYIPGDTPTKDWTVLVRNTYHIIYDNTAVLSDDAPYKVHMEWTDIPIDWKVSSDEALRFGTESGFDGTYCLTYDYFNEESHNGQASQDNDDESETEVTPGYPPAIFKETPIVDGDGQIKMLYRPTLSFFRGAEDSEYMPDAYYVCMFFELALFADGTIMTLPYFPGGVFYPNWESVEKTLEPMFTTLSRFGRLDAGKAEDLIENGVPIELKYTYPNGDYIKLVIQVQE